MTLSTIALIVVALIAVQFVWDILDPQALATKYNSSWRMIPSLATVAALLAFFATALSLSTMAVALIVAIYIAAGAISAAVR